MRDVIVLGSTGSIGTQALDIIRDNPAAFRLVGISGNSNLELLAAQQQEFNLADHQVAKGPVAASEMVSTLAAEVVVNGITGSAGLAATLAGLESGKIVALANKESLIVGGKLVTERAVRGQIVPVDSEHSALAQCLLAGDRSEVSKLILTASGGPFRGWSKQQLAEVTPEQALKHPTWSMGVVVTTNSATMMNKGLELIEAHLLFDVPFEQIEVTVHPQSVVHSMVEFQDGSVIAQCSPPDMHLPIALGLSWPRRIASVAKPVDWTKSHSWTFEPLDESVFTAVSLARQVGLAGLTYPAVYNAANEQAVAAFHERKLGFLGIMDVVFKTVESHSPAATLSLESVLEAENWAREYADSLIANWR